MIDTIALEAMRATAHQPTTPADCRTAILRLLEEMGRLSEEKAWLIQAITRSEHAQVGK